MKTKTAKEWFKDLPFPANLRAFMNLEEGTTGLYHSLEEALSDFIWENSPEGQEYWKNIYKSLSTNQYPIEIIRTAQNNYKQAEEETNKILQKSRDTLVKAFEDNISHITDIKTLNELYNQIEMDFPVLGLGVKQQIIKSKKTRPKKGEFYEYKPDDGITFKVLVTHSFSTHTGTFEAVVIECPTGTGPYKVGETHSDFLWADHTADFWHKINNPFNK